MNMTKFYKAWAKEIDNPDLAAYLERRAKIHAKRKYLKRQEAKALKEQLQAQQSFEPKEEAEETLKLVRRKRKVKKDVKE